MVYCHYAEEDEGVSCRHGKFTWCLLSMVHLRKELPLCWSQEKF